MDNLQQELLQWLNRKLTIKTAGTPDRFNKSTYTTTILNNTYWIYDNKMTFTVDGQVLNSQIKLYTTTPLNELDVIVIDNNDWRILGKKVEVDENDNTIFYVYGLG